VAIEKADGKLQASYVPKLNKVLPPEEGRPLPADRKQNPGCPGNMSSLPISRSFNSAIGPKRTV